MSGIDWQQVRIGGFPALVKALQAAEGASLAERCELTDALAMAVQRVQVLEARLAAVEHLVGEELLGGIVRPEEMREVVAELGAGWRIERERGSGGEGESGSGEVGANDRRSGIQGETGGIVGETWVPAGQYDWVASYAAAADRWDGDT